MNKNDVYLASGGSMAIWITMQLLAQKGDNFLFPSPGFPLCLTIAKNMEI
jgi:aspartate/methionine/tyrosine aminotransferase